MFIENWKMDFGEYSGLDCSAPCDMYSVLLAHGLIDEPYYGTNELKLTRLSENDCTFYTTASLSEQELAKEKIDLVFYGLDTICDIFFNETLLGSVKNMHRAYEFDVKALAKARNEIRLEFKSPIKYFYQKEKEHHLYIDGATVTGACHLRKAFYMSGWDWAPRLPNIGIFRNVELLCYDFDKIEDFYISQSHENGSVTLDISASTKHALSGLRLEAEIDGKTVVLENGHASITVENPHLWWPNGYGEQYLYDFALRLYRGSELIDTLSRKIGLRTLVLSQDEDADGKGREFCFKVNGVKIFAMGANYVPQDSLPSRITDERIERLIKDCLFANFNCVRVWGGAFYPCDYFYELCDKYGLIVWQDFMVACANVWMTPEFEAEFRAEAIYNVKRIRHHASLGLLCGNNEMEEAICSWPCADGNDPLVREDYLKLYEQIFPAICAELAPQISYTPSSPTSGGGFDKPQDNTRGDVHFWDVWNGSCDFDEYRKHKFRFCSEYGFESLPNIKTIDAFCPEDERNLLSFTMENHQKHWHGNVKLLKYLADAYQMPKDLESTVYLSQLNQASAIKYGVEHFRRCRGYTMGSVYWQLNDSWPVASWSSIDYYGRYKALHYFAKKFYQGVALGLFNEGKQITVNVANETTSRFEGYIKSGVMKNDFTPVWEKTEAFSVDALSSLDVKAFSNSDFNGKSDSYFYTELYAKDGTLLARNTELGKIPKHFKLLKPNIKVEAKGGEGVVYLTLTSGALAKNVQISFKNYDLELSDNYFDLSSPEPYTVSVKTELSPSELLCELSLLSVYDTIMR